MIKPRAWPLMALAMVAFLLGSCTTEQPSSGSERQIDREASRQTHECTFRIVFAPGRSDLDASASRVLRVAAVFVKDSGAAYITPFETAGESFALGDTRSAAVTRGLLRHGVDVGSLRTGRLHDAAPATVPYVQLTVCPLPLPLRRVVPDEPDRRIEYRFDHTALRVPLRNLSYVNWNNVPLEPQRGFAILFQLRDDTASATAENGISACRRNRGHQCADDTEIRISRWTFPDDPGAATLPHPRRVTDYEFSREVLVFGNRITASFALVEGSRVSPMIGCHRTGPRLLPDASAFISDFEAVCTARFVRIAPDIGADMTFRIRNLEEVPSIVESARGFVRQLIVP
ncbi:hypothetical protein [Roseomonas sp. CECT 9278]|uniref:hypothetical protein n=1 Tax=Roseomonas sp. CECT 9278 TaxID=2845823 RepID=UPI001E3F2093|nr:hypothetical protein [Roseomonas sp. CECT 9278]CAH0143130.1 hypothetical protein ROS9278_00526 [Roseomonas sp. CECT 9278]